MPRVLVVVLVAVAGCGNKASSPSDMAMAPPDMTPPPACGGDDCMTSSSIKHLVVVIQENHTFENYFGRYCTAATGDSLTLFRAIAE